MKSVLLVLWSFLGVGTCWLTCWYADLLESSLQAVKDEVKPVLTERSLADARGVALTLAALIAECRADKFPVASPSALLCLSIGAEIRKHIRPGETGRST